MKKITKIFASVLALSMAMSTVVVPMTAEAEAIDYGTKLDWWDFNDPSTIEDFVTPGTRTGSITQVDGFGGKDAADKVALVTGGQDGHNTSKGGSGAAYTSSIITVETDVYVGSGNNFVLYSGSAGGGDNGKRYGIQFTGGKLAQVIPWTYTDIPGQTGINMDAWHKIAIEWNGEDGNVYLYFDGDLVHTFANVLTAGSTGRSRDIRIQGKAYLDNYRVYTTSYDPTGEEMPAVDNDTYIFLSDTMTVAEAKAMLMANQNADTAVARVYKGAVGGTEAEDTETIKTGWYVVVTSKSGSYYRNVHKVLSALSVSATLADGNLTANLTNLSGTVIPSMIMVLVQNNGQVVKASDMVTNIGSAGATFTIEDIGTLVKPEIFFINSWDELTPALNDVTNVTQ